MDFINKSDHVFTDISSEDYRVYEFSGFTIEIDKPLWLSVSESGGHRIFDSAGFSHYIPTGWIHLAWRVKEGQPHFVK